MPQHELALHVRPAQIQVAVFHAQFISAVAKLFNGEGRSFAGVQHLHFSYANFNLAGGHIEVFAFAFGNSAAHLQHKFPTQFPCLLSHFGASFQVKRQLSNAISVAQVNKSHSS